MNINKTTKEIAVTKLVERIVHFQDIQKSTNDYYDKKIYELEMQLFKLDPHYHDKKLFE